MSNIKYKLVFSSKVIYTNNFAAFHRVYFERKNRRFLVNRRNMRHNLSTVPMWQFRSWLQFQYSTGRSDSSGYTHTTKFVKTYNSFFLFPCCHKDIEEKFTINCRWKCNNCASHRFPLRCIIQRGELINLHRRNLLP